MHPPLHDASYKQMFSSPQVVRDLLAKFVPEPWITNLSFDTLERVNCTFVGPRGEDRRADVVWRVKVNDEWLYLYILIEFQSRIDPSMAVRMMIYVCLLYQDLMREGVTPPQTPFPPVLPIVLYNGEPAWTAQKEVGNLITPMPPHLKKYLPRMEHLVIDMNDYDPVELSRMENLVACIMLFERPVEKATLTAVVTKLKRLLAKNVELQRTFAKWIPAVVDRRSKGKIKIPEAQDLEETGMRLEQCFEVWEREAVEKGIEQGRKEGETHLLREFLVHQHGALSQDVLDRIAAASSDQIGSWFKRALTARGLDEVFGA